jgi:hypothetical protein
MHFVSHLVLNDAILDLIFCSRSVLRVGLVTRAAV